MRSITLSDFVEYVWTMRSWQRRFALSRLESDLVVSRNAERIVDFLTHCIADSLRLRASENVRITIASELHARFDCTHGLESRAWRSCEKCGVLFWSCRDCGHSRCADCAGKFGAVDD